MVMVLPIGLQMRGRKCRRCGRRFNVRSVWEASQFPPALKRWLGGDVCVVGWREQTSLLNV